MNLRQILLAIRSRYKIALVLFAVIAGAALSVSFRLPVRYTATASVLVDAGPRDALTAMIMPHNLTTQIEIIEMDALWKRLGHPSRHERTSADAFLQSISCPPMRRPSVVSFVKMANNFRTGRTS